MAMKDKEKQIEEMVKDFKSYLPSAWYNDKCVNGEVYSMVKHAYEDNYRKIPEDSVVLTREEYEHLKAKSTRIPIDKDGNFIEYAVYDTDRVLSKPEYRDYIYEKCSKETAEKIINFMKKFIDSWEDDEKVAKFVMIGYIKAVAKEFGVEIKIVKE